jgi:hypothetical protein
MNINVLLTAFLEGLKTNMGGHGWTTDHFVNIIIRLITHLGDHIDQNVYLGMHFNQPGFEPGNLNNIQLAQEIVEVYSLNVVSPLTVGLYFGAIAFPHIIEIIIKFLSAFVLLQTVADNNIVFLVQGMNLSPIIVHINTIQEIINENMIHLAPNLNNFCGLHGQFLMNNFHVANNANAFLNALMGVPQQLALVVQNPLMQQFNVNAYVNHNFHVQMQGFIVALGNNPGVQGAAGIAGAAAVGGVLNQGAQAAVRTSVVRRAVNQIGVYLTRWNIAAGHLFHDAINTLGQDEGFIQRNQQFITFVGTLLVVISSIGPASQSIVTFVEVIRGGPGRN